MHVQRSKETPNFKKKQKTQTIKKHPNPERQLSLYSVY